MKRFVFLFLAILFFSDKTFGKDGFHFYQLDGKWGVLYNGEPCLLPRFEEVSSIDNVGRFFYKENGKWGIANIWKKISEPFCDSLLCYHAEHKAFFIGSPKAESAIDYNVKTLYLFLKKGKWGVCAADGKEVIPPLYDRIYNKTFDWRYFDIPSKDVYVKKDKQIHRTWLADNLYFLVQEGNSSKLIDICGATILQDINGFDYFLSKPINKKLKKKVRDIEKKRNKDRKNDLEEMISQGVSRYCNKVTNENVLIRNYIRDDYGHSDFKTDKYRIDEMKTPRKIFFGVVNGELGLPKGDTLVIGGFKSIVNDYGFISTPLVYDSPYFRLQRNSLDVFAYLKLLDQERVDYLYFGGPNKYYVEEEDIISGKVGKNISILRQKINSYKELLYMSEQIHDTEAYTTVDSIYNSMQERLAKFENGYKNTLDNMEFAAKVDRIGNTISSFANSMIGAFGGSNTSSNVVSSYSNSSIGKTNESKAMASKMTMSDQVNYNSLRSTYNKWASDLMQMKNANGRYQNGYSTNDKRHAQSEMKRIRKEAMSKWGKEIPYNSLEDWK